MKLFSGLFVVVLFANVVVPSGVQAQSADSNTGVLEEITVTARKRTENLQETPISMMVFGGQALEDQNVTGLENLDAKLPNVGIGGSLGLGGSNASFFIRGLGSPRNAINQEAAVALYVDDAYYGRSDGALLSVLDIERIEVARGPQGTLFGRGATAGAIRYITKKPTDEFEGSVQITAGSFSRLDVKGVLNVPVGDSFAARISAASLKKDGHVTGSNTGLDYGNVDSSLVRTHFLWSASDAVEILASVDYTKIDSNGSAFILAAYDPTKRFAAQELAGGFGAVGLPLNDFDTSYATSPSFYDSESLGLNATLSWALTDGIDLKAVVSNRDIDISGAVDGDATPASLFDQSFERDIEMSSEELQLLGRTDRLNWVIGLFHYSEKASDIRPVELTANTTPNRSSTRIVDPSKVESVAIFGQGTFDLSDRWSITLGLRYTDDEKSISANELQADGTPRQPENVTNKDSWTAPSGRLSLEYQATDEVFLFASYARGFRSGGFNDRIRNDLGAENNFGITGFDDEALDMYELGIRSEFLDSRARLNVTGFFGILKDMQLSSLVAGTNRLVVDNIGEAELKGIEAQFQFALSDAILVDGAFGYLDAAYTKVGGQSNVTTSSKLPRAPEFSYTFGLEASAFSDNLVTRLDYSWQDDAQAVVPDSSILIQPSYGLLSANISYALPNSDITFAVFGTNLTDEEYGLGAFDISGGALGFGVIEPGRPREYGAKFTWNF